MILWLMRRLTRRRMVIIVVVITADIILGPILWALEVKYLWPHVK